MGLTDIAGVFSRYFIVGFFLPSLFALFAFALTNPFEWLRPDDGSDVLVLGGVALLLGLLLVGVRDSVHAFYSGYKLTLVAGLAPSDAEIRRSWHDPFGGPLKRRLRRGQRRRRLALKQHIREHPLDAVAVAALSTRFGTTRAKKSIRPTRLGNRARAFEDHVADRYGLRYSAWLRVQPLLTDREHELLTEADTDQFFFLNASLTAGLTGIALGVLWLVDAVHTDRPVELLWSGVAGAVGAGVSWLSYCSAVGPAGKTAAITAAAFDGHVRQLYEQFGLRPPSSRADEVAFGTAITRFIDRGEPIPQELRRRDAAAGGDPATPPS